MRDYTEKRDFIRVPVACNMTFRVPGSEQRHQAMTTNLSGKGVQFETGHQISPGHSLEITVIPGLPTTPPLHALVEVVRVAPAERGDRFLVAAAIQEITA